MTGLFGYCTVLRSMTGGRGSYAYEFARYEQAPSDVQEKEIAARARVKQNIENLKIQRNELKNGRRSYRRIDNPDSIVLATASIPDVPRHFLGGWY